MTREEILNWWFTPDLNANPYIYAKEEDGIYGIHKIGLMLTRSKDAFAYIIQYPGPICDVYKFEDYGKTWAFTVEELKDDISGQQEQVHERDSTNTTENN